MKKEFLPSIKMFILLTLLTGFVYPLLMTAVGYILYPGKTAGSMIVVNGKIVGSELIGQKFGSPKYFWPRPSAVDYNPLPSGAGNLGPTSDTLRQIMEARWNDFHARNGIPAGVQIPADMLGASGSGLDPEISPASAEMQMERVARARGFTGSQKAALASTVKRYSESRQFHIFGDPRVNVFLLNLAVDSIK